MLEKKEGAFPVRTFRCSSTFWLEVAKAAYKVKLSESAFIRLAVQEKIGRCADCGNLLRKKTLKESVG